ncbi:MAG: YbgC/FadM family acyl-CoA thioesterase [Pseudomonadota bacterium]
MSEISDLESDLSGELTAEGHSLFQRIYFEDTDFSGVVYHARYLHFLERGRSDFVRVLGVHHAALYAGEHGEPLAFAVRHMDLDFLQPARIDDIIEVRTQPAIVKGVRMILNQSIRCQEKELLRATVTAVLINDEGRPRRFPKTMLKQLLLDDDD